MLVVRAGDGRFAVRLSEIASVERCRKIVPLPSALPGLLGVAGVKRRVFAVYGLGALLGAGRTDEPPRWLLLGPSLGDSIAFAIEELERYIEIAPSRIHPVEGGATNEFVRELVAQDDIRWPAIHVRSLVDHALRAARGDVHAGGRV
jgi:chemotaxis signal transduction protein